MTRTRFAMQAREEPRDVAYRHYMIRRHYLGWYWIERDGVSLGGTEYPTVEAAKAVIDELLRG